MYFNKWMVKQAAVHPYQETVLSNKKEHLLTHATTWTNLQKTIYNKKKKILNGNILDDSIYITFQNDKISEMENRLVVARS